MKTLENQIRQLALAINEISSRPLPSYKEDDEMWECNIVASSFEEELLSPTLVEEDENELAIEKEPLMQVNEKNLGTRIENVLLGSKTSISPLICDLGHGGGPTIPIYRKTLHFHKLSVDRYRTW